jgi:hypothetical protein
MNEESKPVTAYYEHKESKRTDDTTTTSSVLASVNQLQHRLGKIEQETKLMRDAINDIGQHLCNTNGLKLRWEGIKGLDGDV